MGKRIRGERMVKPSSHTPHDTIPIPHHKDSSSSCPTQLENDSNLLNLTSSNSGATPQHSHTSETSSNAAISLSDLPPPSHPESSSSSPFLTLNVGGTCYRTTTLTLQKEPGSLLALAFRNPDAFLPTDPNGHYFIDRDGRAFRHVLNYLRGYPVVVPPEELALLSCDVHYYGLESMKPLLGLHPVEEWTFVPGPGVEESKKRVRSSYMVSLCGEGWMREGAHTQEFHVERADYVGIGVVSRLFVDQGTEFHQLSQCAVYYMSGVLYANFESHRKIETAESFTDGDHITVSVNYQDGCVTWLRNEETIHTASMGEGNKYPELKFAVVLKRASVVHLVPMTTASSTES